jgi:hypothetical protein
MVTSLPIFVSWLSQTVPDRSSWRRPASRVPQAPLHDPFHLSKLDPRVDAEHVFRRYFDRNATQVPPARTGDDIRQIKLALCVLVLEFTKKRAQQRGIEREAPPVAEADPLLIRARVARFNDAVEIPFASCSNRP